MRKIDSEKLVERKLVEHVKLNQGLCIKLPGDSLIGIPDRLCLFPGRRVVFVELKTTGQKPRRVQLFVHDKLRSMGFRVEVIDTVEGVIKFIEEMKQC